MTKAPVAALPTKLSPQLATLATEPPSGGDWVYEIKFDGYRLLARIEQGQCRLFTRNGNDWTDKMASLATAIAEIGIKSGWLDCEAVVLSSDGMPNFNALQNAFDRYGTESIKLFVFDLPYLEGYDLRALPLRTRRAVLREQLSAVASDRIRFSEEFVAPGASVLESACKMGLEGVMAKRGDAPYVLKRTTTWLKLKCHLRQEFVVGGFSARSNAAKEVGSLLLGVYDDEGKLRSAGSVGTGWNSKAGAAMWQQLAKLEVKHCPFEAKHAPTKGRRSKRTLGGERWVTPRLVAEVRFAEWTANGSVRHASFLGLREDKEPETVRREYPVRGGARPAPAPTSKASKQNRR
jgi:bifunctional non-homologous end joining protein LigD